jgi:hypothetical protein
MAISLRKASLKTHGFNSFFTRLEHGTFRQVTPVTPEQQQYLAKTEKEEELRAAKEFKERFNQPLAPGERICRTCGAKYKPGDYDSDAPTWSCSMCKAHLPKE